MIENKFTKRLVFVLVALMFLAASLFMFFSGFNVEADSQLINFNQLFDNVSGVTNTSTTLLKSISNYVISFNGYFTSYNMFLGTGRSINLISGHKYFLKFNLINNGNTPVSLRIGTSMGGTNHQYNTGNSDQLFVSSVDDVVDIGLLVYSSQNSQSNPYNFSISPVLIDLTQAFGSLADSLTLDQVESYFPSTYYVYTQSTLINLSDLSYQQGFEDGMKQYDNLDSYTLVYALALNNVKANGSLLYGSVASDGSITFSNVGYHTLVFDVQLEFGFRYVIKWDYISPAINDSYYYLELFNGNGGNENDVDEANYTNGVITFDFFSNGSSTEPLFVSLTQYDYNISSITIKNFYIYKSNTIQASYDDGYFDGYTTGRQDGYNNGVNYAKSIYYSKGYQEGVEFSNVNNFGYLMTSVVEAPLNAILDMFNFDFLGYNMKNFITLILTVCIVVAVVRLFLGGK